MTKLPQRLCLLAFGSICASPMSAANAETIASGIASAAKVAEPAGASPHSAPLGEHWSFRTYGNIGGFGVSSHFTWQVYGLIEYDLSQRWSLAGGWRHLSTDFDQEGFVFDARMDGPILGAIYRF